jgi:N-acyl-D-aspartate/D-glutamate deacylase
MRRMLLVGAVALGAGTVLEHLAASPRISPLETRAADFDLVIRGGRVLDPESGLDAIRNVGIRHDTIVRIGSESMSGSRVIDAAGLVVAPGFIDLNRHVQSRQADSLTVLDGVTTALEFENGVPDLSLFVRARRGNALVHHGATASYWAARIRAWSAPMPVSLNGPDAGLPPPRVGPVTDSAASAEKLALILADLKKQLDAGALGVGMGLEYIPGATRHEVIEVFRLAAKYDVPVFVHARSAGLLEPGSSIESLGELIGAAAVSGASLHVVHLNSTCPREARECLAMIAGARARGLDVTTEAYPYTVASASITSAFFSPGWREKRGLDYSSIQLPETGERLTRERFDSLRALTNAKYVLIHLSTDDVLDVLLGDSTVAIASDGLVSHPRMAGTFARVLAEYVRDRTAISLLDAVRKMSLLPARRLERSTIIGRRLGRLQQGMQADIVVFDPRSIKDRATFTAPRQPSIGVRFLLVSGSVVVDGGQVVEGVLPGRVFLADRPGSKAR